ncbi:2-phospho-L-lactate guanylyltransferase [Bradyrhizobium sp. NP1]|jgi:2-phospho-L-lactate guanylyltransferase|uniref:2-phospho-L-lactate guanylyltransferase n=1 Tax=Bradyrhizobium sp. NP1 TaxID=3049772 RepID=UPI0025A67A53|nr:2-phospho-L-lactate guanylyltransferase [Bradyrhizobium sp. NP1]WJR77880.1 2-phospho-L-lactate guanylyltransferase [Bradyrhizobium sp. NP1]
MTPQVWALVPVKRLSEAKQRLSDILSPGERLTLAQAMLRDVLGSLRAAPSVAGIVVVSADRTVHAIARAFDAKPILDASESGINDAVRRGFDALPADAGVLVAPSDIPFATPEDFEQVTALLELNPVVLAPALSDGGTNALAMRSPNLIAPHFGEHSFERHRAVVRQKRLCCGVLRSERIGRDIDVAQDLELQMPPAGASTQTASFVRSFDRTARPQFSDPRVAMRLS